MSPETAKRSNKNKEPLFAANNTMRETSFLFPCWRITMERKLLLATIFLVLALFFERFCFLVTVYKTKYFGYVLILLVIFLNSVFNFFNVRLRKTKHKKRLHEMFNIERTPKISYFLIGFIG